MAGPVIAPVRLSYWAIIITTAAELLRTPHAANCMAHVLSLRSLAAHVHAAEARDRDNQDDLSEEKQKQRSIDPARLRDLDARARDLTGVDGRLCARLTSLERLDLRDNRLSDGLALVEALRPLSVSLQRLDVRGNPLLGASKKARFSGLTPKGNHNQETEQAAEFHQRVLRTFPLLRELDGRRVLGGVLGDFIEPPADSRGAAKAGDTEALGTTAGSTDSAAAVAESRSSASSAVDDMFSGIPVSSSSSRSSAPAYSSPAAAEDAVADVVSRLLNAGDDNDGGGAPSGAEGGPVAPANHSPKPDIADNDASKSAVPASATEEGTAPASKKEKPSLPPRKRTSTQTSNALTADDVFGKLQSVTVSPAHKSSPASHTSSGVVRPRADGPAPPAPNTVDQHGFPVAPAAEAEYERYVQDKHATLISAGRDSWEKLVSQISKVKLHAGADVYETLALHERRRLRQLVLESGVPLEHSAALWMACSGALAKKRGADLNSESGAYLRELIERNSRKRKQLEDAPPEIPGSRSRSVSLSSSSSSAPRSRSSTMASSAARSKKVMAEIARDTGRTFRTHYRMNATVQTQLQRLLEAYARRNKALGYCQSMNFLVAWPLILCGGIGGATDGRITLNDGRDAMLDSDESYLVPGLTPPSMIPLAEQSFWLLSTLVEDLLPGFWSKTMTSLHVSYRVVDELLQLKLPLLHAHLQKLGVMLPLVMTKWVLNLFADSLPSETTRHVWTCLFVEVCCASGGTTSGITDQLPASSGGSGEAALHFVYRVCFALLHAATPSVLAAEDVFGVFAAIEEVVGTMFDWKSLLRASVLGGPRANLKKVKETVVHKGSRHKGSLATIDVPDDDLLRHLRRKHARGLHAEVQEIRQRKDIAELSQLTHFSAEEVESLRGQFRFLARQRIQSTGCEVRDSVNMNYDQFSNAVARTFNAVRGGGTGDAMLKRLFKSFDRDGDGRIDFREMILGLSVLTQGTVEERLEMLFSAMLIETSESGTDAEGDIDSISKDELHVLLQGVFKQIYDDAEGVFRGEKHESVGEFVDHVMKNLDTDGDGRLTLDEFKRISVLEPQLVEALVMHAPDEDMARFTEVLETNRELPAWEPDQARDECPICGERFALVLKRKHHCRRCGRVVCNQCSRHNVVVRGAGDAPVRVCNSCAGSFGELRPPPLAEIRVANRDVELP
jgi:Ca2+-binding EF-hand superfamily protein